MATPLGVRYSFCQWDWLHQMESRSRQKAGKNAVVLAAAIIAALHLDGKGDNQKNRAVIAEAMRVLRYMYRNLSIYFPELFR
jgi:hypothetical protein